MKEDVKGGRPAPTALPLLLGGGSLGGTAAPAANFGPECTGGGDPGGLYGGSDSRSQSGSVGPGPRAAAPLKRGEGSVSAASPWWGWVPEPTMSRRASKTSARPCTPLTGAEGSATTSIAVTNSEIASRMVSQPSSRRVAIDIGKASLQRVSK